MLAEDPVLLASFLDESRESLDGLESRLVDLDDAQDMRAEVDAIFRPVHTLKGNAPFFGFTQVQRLAHTLETVLDHLRKGRLAPSQALTNELLAGLDGLRGCIDSIQQGGPEVTNEAAFLALLDRLTAAAAAQAPADAWTRLDAAIIDLETHGGQSDPSRLALFMQMRQDLATLRGVAGSQTPIGRQLPEGDRIAALRQRLAQPLTDLLDPAAALAVVADLRAVRAVCRDQTQIGLLDETLATCSVFLDSVGFDDLLRRHILDAIGQLSVPTATADPQPTSALNRAPEPATERRTRPDSESHAKSMRVSEASVDGFLEHVGEMLVIGDLLEHLQLRISSSTSDHGLIRDVRQAVASFSMLSTDLQRSIMAVRRVQVRGLLQKAPRLARDIAQASGKDIEVALHGETTEIDKGRLDLLDGPLTHLVRNCADHGIESPEQRTAAGKPARGTITLTASSDAEWFSLDIDDDGRGLDLEAIRRKGEALGLVQPGASLDEQTIVNLIFASGLSTAKTVTDVSGRGVGMDVVNRQIHDAGGIITVTTTPGQGTRFSIRLPSAVSTQIVSAFLVRDGTGAFALPLDMVRESFAESEDQQLQGPGLVLRQGKVLSVAPLGQILDQAGTAPTGVSRRRTLVTLERGGTTLAVSVDETLGVRRLVIRPLYGMTAGDLDGRFQGAALLGDGRLALVVSPDFLVRHLTRDEPHA